MKYKLRISNTIKASALIISTMILIISCTLVDDKPKVGIMIFDTSEGVNPSTGKIFYEGVKDLLEKSGKYNILNWSKIHNYLESIKKSDPEIYEGDARIMLMKQQKITKMYTGYIYKLRENYYITIKVLKPDFTIDKIITVHTALPGENEKALNEIAEKLLEKNQDGKVKFEGQKPGKIRKFEGIEFVYIPPGKFKMGASSTEKGRDIDELPLHEVEITAGFWMSRFEITQNQWEHIMFENPSFFKGDKRLPVDSVSWAMASEFVEKLNHRGNGRFRLPTEAEWEYACRAGSETSFTFGDSREDLERYAWFGNSGGSTHPVGLKKPNPWGLHDMHGNVWEWCQDSYLKEYYYLSPTKDPTGPLYVLDYVRRGGCWRHSANYSRSASRAHNPPLYTATFVGFRIIREL